MFRYIIAFAILLLVLVVLYVRLSPFDAARFHKAATLAEPGDYQKMNSFVAIRQITASPADVIKALDRVVTRTSRTKRVAGEMGQSVVTYETRSLVFGFPDYTSVSIIEQGTIGNEGPLLAIKGQARFGMSDIGVNRNRIENWLDALGPLTVAP